MYYSFRKIGTEEEIELSMPMSERETYLKDNPDMEQIIIKCPGIVDPLMLGKMNAKGKDFQRSVLDRMKAAIPHNQMHTSKLNSSREI